MSLISLSSLCFFCFLSLNFTFYNGSASSPSRGLSLGDSMTTADILDAKISKRFNSDTIFPRFNMNLTII